MIILLCLGLFLLLVFSVFIRTIVLNPVKSIYYCVIDTFNFFAQRRFNLMETGKLICYTALFGGGKTLSCVHYVLHLYNRYNNKRVYDVSRHRWVTQKVHVISNVDLNIPFERFEGLYQIVRVAEKFRDIDKENNTLTCTIVLGDEFSVQMNSRSFKTNIDPDFLNSLLTCRHHHIMMVYNAQRFNHVDKLLRDVTTYVVECKKIWRVCIQKTYDAFVLENTVDISSVRPLARRGWFVTDKDFAAYDTLACVGNLIKKVSEGDMESEIEIINRRLGGTDKDIGSVKRQKKLVRKLRR